MELFSCESAVPGQRASSEVRLRVIHGDALLGRIAVLLNNYEIIGFSYMCEIDGPCADVVMTIRGEGGATVRIAAKMRRVIGVTDVVIA